MKKFFIGMIILFSTMSFGVSESFVDVKTTDWFYDAVQRLYISNIISGYGDQTFRPQENISVEEFITLTIKVIGETEADIEKIRWSDGFIKKAEILQLVQLGEFQNFTRMITRGEMSRIILRAANMDVPDDYWSYGQMIYDLSEMDVYWQNIAVRVFSTGIISGYPDGRFDLNGLATRAEAAAILLKVYDPTLIKPPVLVVNYYEIRKKQIQDLWDIIKYKENGDVFVTSPNLTSPYSSGTLTTSYLDEASNILNFMRSLAYLDGNTYYTDTANSAAQHGAVLNAVSSFSHTPTQPVDMDNAFYEKGYEATSSSNLAAGINPLSFAIKRLFDDEDVDNIERIGHRRWFLLPSLFEVGYGYVQQESEWRYYSVIKVFRDLVRKTTSYNQVLWPSETAFPLDFFDSEIPWSISLNPEIYNNERVSEINVVMENVTTGLTIVFDSSDKSLDGEFFNVETSGYGIPFCIIFRPDFNSISPYESGDLIKIKVNNLYLLNGEKLTLSYNTRFFDLK